MSYAVIKTGGKQYRVAEGDHLLVDLIHEKAKGDSLVFDQVLMVKNGEAYSVGCPTVSGAKVTATVVDAEQKGKKVWAFQRRRRKGSRRKVGHRQRYTRIKIESIAG